MVSVAGIGGMAGPAFAGVLADRVSRGAPFWFLAAAASLVVVMLVRPQGLIPSRERQQELTKGTHDDTIIEDVNAATT